MLSYQHIYHAGNAADVHKHMALSAILEKLMSAGKPLTYMETHAGRGVYDLTSMEAIKTSEADFGIKKLLSKIPKHHPYAKAIDRVRLEGGKDMYPGSPYIARTILERSQLHLFELHPKEFAELKANITGVNLHNKDGYDSVAIMPPKERRGLILIDPSYEVKTEYMDASDYITQVQRRWPQAVILLWYPILEAGHHKKMIEELKGAWKQEILFNSGSRMLGSGLLAFNLRPETIKELEKIPAVFE